MAQLFGGRDDNGNGRAKAVGALAPFEYVSRAQFRETMPTVRIEKIYRVQNGYLFKRYHQELKRVARKNNDGNWVLSTLTSTKGNAVVRRK